MKIAVYTIAKNEEQFVSRWADSCVDSDYRIILDTGSTDNTFAVAEKLDVIVSRETFDPWRFDTARNKALSLVPEDVDMCIALDMDEVLIPGWRSEIERAIADGTTRPRYKYTWSWKGHGIPDLQYGGDKIHTRHGYKWKHPVHEVIVPDGIEERQGWYDLEIHHHPDASKSRSQYLPLLELAVQEDPEDDRNAHYLAREYYFAGRYEEAAAEFMRHLNLESSKWDAERSSSMRYLAKCLPDEAEVWLIEAVQECPTSREAWADLAQHYYDNEEWDDAVWAAKEGLKIKERPLAYLTRDYAWGSLLDDIAAISCYRLGFYREAQYHGIEALRLEPYNERLQNNLEFYWKAAA